MLEQKENVYDWREVRSQVHDCNMTMAELLELWMAANSYNVKLSTSERYHFVIERHILPELGRIPVCEMTPEILENFVDYKLRYGRLDGKGGMSPKSVNDICMIIKSALKRARRRYSYNGADMEEVRGPVAKGSKIEVFGESETRIIARAVLRKPTITNLAIMISLEAGLRLGEVCSLKWSDIDFKDRVVHVNRTVIRINYGGNTGLVIQTPKSDASERVVPLTERLLTLLAEEAEGENPDTYILTRSVDTPLDPRTMQNRFRNFQKSLGMKPRNYHATRHSFATRCVEHGIDAKTLSEILGHANVKTTLQMYVHPSMEAKRHYLEMASAISRKTSTDMQKSVIA